MLDRFVKGRKIFEKKNIILDQVKSTPEELHFWIIGGTDEYEVVWTDDDEIVCDCKDFINRGLICKHIHAVIEFMIDFRYGDQTPLQEVYSDFNKFREEKKLQPDIQTKL